MQKPIQGSDVSVIANGPNGPVLVGEFQTISLKIQHDTEEYMPLGSRMPIYLDGDIKLSGSLDRGYIDVTNDLQDAFGSSELAPGMQFATPRLVVYASFNAPAKGLVGRKAIGGVVINNLDLNAQQGKNVVKSTYSFQAETLQNA